jgi:hypothetical protein
MAGWMSTYLQGKIADEVLGGAAFAAPATVYVALFTALPTAKAGTGGTEATGGSYARVAVTNNTSNWNDYAAGVKSNKTDFAFTQATASWGEIQGYGLYDSSSAGNLLFAGPLTAASKGFTALGSSDVITCYAHGYSDTNTVFVEASVPAALPSGLNNYTKYFVRDASTDTFKLSLTSGGAAIDIGNGCGLVAKVAAQTVDNENTAKFLAGTLQIKMY